MPAPQLQPQDVGVQKARPLELFFDLVFVFTITQITHLVAEPHHMLDYLQAVLIFISLMWMYEAFIWLTSNITLETSRESWLIFSAMLLFFMMAIGLSTLEDSGRVIFGFGLLMLVIIHTAMFSRVTTSSRQGIYSIAPFNFAFALLMLASAFVDGGLRWGLGLSAIAVLAVATARRPEQSFSLSPRHFAERHSLLVIIVLGETIMDLGLGASKHPLSLQLLTYTSLGLLLSAYLWWSYFGPNNEKAEHAFLHAQLARRNYMALQGYSIAHMVVLFGVVLVAAGLEMGVHEVLHPTSAPGAWNLAVGIALYVLGITYFHYVVGLNISWLRIAEGLLALTTVIIGLNNNALWQLAACVGILIVFSLLEDYFSRIKPS